MGQNDRFNSNSRFLGTYTSIPQGAAGSSYLSGDGAKVDLNGLNANAYVFAITFLTASQFQALENLDGNIGGVSTLTGECAHTSSFGTDANAVTMSIGGSGQVFEKEITLYGSWDFVELHSGAAICYLAHK